jgi:hypothetical protein
MNTDFKQFKELTYQLDDLRYKMCMSESGEAYCVVGYEVVDGKTEEVEERYGFLNKKTRMVKLTTPTYISRVYGKFSHNIKNNTKSVWGEYDEDYFSQKRIKVSLIDMIKKDRERYLRLKKDLLVFGVEIKGKLKKKKKK